MDDCGKYRDMIDRLLDGELSDEEEMALRAHMESCGDCRRIHDAYRAIADTLSKDLVEPPEGLAFGVKFRITANEEAEKKARKRFSARRVGLLAACLALMLFAGYQLDRWSQNHASNDTAATLQAPAEEFGTTSESAPEYAAAPAEDSEMAGAGTADAAKGTDRGGAAYSRVRIDANGQTVLDSDDAQTISSLTDGILLSAGEAQPAPDRAPDYTVTLTAQDTGETSSFEVWIAGEELRWRPASGDEVFLSPASATDFQALLSGS